MDVCVARHPIFDAEKNVVAYELLFRKNINNNECNSNDNADEATATVITNAFLTIGIDVLTGGKKTFINFTENYLLSGVAELLPVATTGVELPKDLEVDDYMLKTCKDLKRYGYTLVVDDFLENSQLVPLLEFVDIVKLDFQKSQTEEKKELISQMTSERLKFLAIKVETMEDFESAIEYGFKYFQGYFFSKPLIVARKELPVNRVSQLQLLQEIANENIDLLRLENIIKHDVSLSFQLLKYINSATFSLRRQVQSIQQAVALLGKKEICKWIVLVTVKDVAQDKPNELFSTAAVRGRFCELLAINQGYKMQVADFFFIGLFSFLDAFLDRAMEDILSELPISEVIKNAILGKEGIYASILNIAIAYEKGNWEKVDMLSAQLKISSKDILEIYKEAISWEKDFASSST